MKINSKKILGSILVMVLLTACSSKEETVSYNDNINKTKEKVDTKISNIKTVQSKVIDNGVSSISKSSEFNEVTSKINGVNITLTSIHFGFDNYKMTDEMTNINSNNTKKIEPILISNKNLKIKLEGNCDEWGTDEYNFALGLKRAKTVKNALINNGINSSDIIVVSLGESNPVCNDQTASCWKKNRRVDHKLLP